MPVPYHTHTFTIPTASDADIDTGTDDQVVVTPAKLARVKLPQGGATGQILAKANGNDYNVEWQTNPGLPADLQSLYFADIPEAESATIPDRIIFVQIGLAYYVRGDSEPSHDLGWQDAGGQWWDIDFARQPKGDPALFGASTLGTTDGRAVWQKVFDAYVANAAANGVATSIKPSPGAYGLEWDGTSGDVDFAGAAATGLNQRWVFSFDGVDGLELDFSDIIMKQLASTEDTTAPMFRIRDCKNVRVLAPRMDYANLPFFQGTIDAVGSDYVDILLEDGCPPPAFPFVRQLEPRNADRVPSAFGLKRGPFDVGVDPLTLEDQGGGIWRVGGITPAEMSGMTAYFVEGTLFVARGITDGPDWFQFVKCDGVEFIGGDAFASACSATMFALCKNVTLVDTNIRRRPGSKLTATCSRAGHKLFSLGGTVRLEGADVQYTGDDAFAVGPGTITDLVWQSATVFDGFMSAHYVSATLDPGDHLTLRTSEGVEQARLIVTDVAEPGSPSYNRRFTVSVVSGSIPTDLTDYYCGVDEYTPIVHTDAISGYGIRGRTLYAGAGGTYDGISSRHTTGTGIQIDYGQTATGVMINEQDHLILTDFYVDHACNDSFYSGAVVVRQIAQGSESGTTSGTSSGFPLKNVLITDGIISHTPNTGLVIGGADAPRLSNILFDDVCSVGNTLHWNGGKGANAVVLALNCRDLVGTDCRFNNIHSKTIFVDDTEFGGTKSNNVFDNYFNNDLATLVRGFTTKMGFGTTSPTEQSHTYVPTGSGGNLIETTGSQQAQQKFKNANRAYTMLMSDNGLFIRDETAAQTRWGWNNSGHFTPTTDNAVDLGAPSARPRYLYTYGFDAVGAIRMTPEQRTATQIADITNTINTTGKSRGKLVEDTTNHRWLYASGGTAASDWYVIDGSVTVTPA